MIIWITNSYANDRLRLCDLALNKCKKVTIHQEEQIDNLKVLVRHQKGQIDALTKEVVELEETSFFKSPIFLIGIGVIGGALLYKKLL